MTDEEYFLKSNFPDFYPLSTQDVFDGWHVCPEWGCLVGPGTPLEDMCECYLKINYDKLREK